MKKDNNNRLVKSFVFLSYSLLFPPEADKSKRRGERG
jgi:hypothetical protein